MSEDNAQHFAGQVIGLLLQHQQDPLGLKPLDSVDAARKAALNLATFRKALIEELTKKN